MKPVAESWSLKAQLADGRRPFYVVGLPENLELRPVDTYRLGELKKIIAKEKDIKFYQHTTTGMYTFDNRTSNTLTISLLSVPTAASSDQAPANGSLNTTGVVGMPEFINGSHV